MPSRSDSIESVITAFFEENYAILQLEAGHVLSPTVREVALQQLLMYWKKLSHIADSVTDTEVHLTLSDLTTPTGRPYSIEGVVDIVREQGRITMYDIKTHDVQAIKANPEIYERQLNVYAYIWQTIHGQNLDETAIISTRLPSELRYALTARDVDEIDQALNRWNPVVPIVFKDERVQDTIRRFGEVVDRIERRQFSPPKLSQLYEKKPGTNHVFASDICANCDARYSCSSYKQYLEYKHQGQQMYAVEERGDEKEDRLTAALNALDLEQLND